MAMRTVLAVLQTPASRGFSTFAGRAAGRAYDIPANVRTNTALEVVQFVHGDPQIALCDRCEPIKKPLQYNEVLVKMLLAPVHPCDLDVVCGRYHQLPTLPCVAGCEGVGEVIEVGCGVTRFGPGSWVIPNDFGFGTWRTQLVCSEDNLICIPNDVPVIGAATLSVAPCTAYRLLKGVMHLDAHDVIIQSAANSTVGQAVIQLAAKWGIHTVNVVRDRPEVNDMVTRLKSLGATHVITDRFLASDHMAHFIKALRKKPCMAIDTVGGKIANDMARHVEEGGVFATYGELTEDPDAFHRCGLDIRRVQVFGFWKSMWCCEHLSGTTMDQVVWDIANDMRFGLFKPPPCEIYNLVRYRDACRKAKVQFKKKKVLLKMDPDLKIQKVICEKHNK